MIELCFPIIKVKEKVVNKVLNGYEVHLREEGGWEKLLEEQVDSIWKGKLVIMRN